VGAVAGGIGVGRRKEKLGQKSSGGKGGGLYECLDMAESADKKEMGEYRSKGGRS